MGINDIFFSVLPRLKTYQFNIYNSWGDHLFATGDQSISWNGYYKNKLCQSDVYIYKIRVIILNNREENYIGLVTLV